MKLSKTLVIPVAGLLVVLGAGAVLASTSSSPAASGAAVAPGGRIAVAGRVRTPRSGVKFQDQALTTVLDDLVAKGTITAAQKTGDRRRPHGRARAAPRRAQGQDGGPPGAGASRSRASSPTAQITQAELDQLPADSPLRKLTNLMDDGKITTDELRSIGRGWFGGRGHGFGRASATTGTSPTHRLHRAPGPAADEPPTPRSSSDPPATAGHFFVRSHHRLVRCVSVADATRG